MTQFEKLLRKMRQSPGNIRFDQLQLICEHYFGTPRQQGTSHCIYKTGMQEAPRITIQSDHSGKAKTYQVKQVITAIDMAEKQKEEHHD